MKIEQLYTKCLAEAAYYIESEGEAVIIDPLREVEPYIEMARMNGAKIKYIFETHFHADFVSGHVDLSKKTGAPIVYGPEAKTSFDSINAKDGQEFKVGKISLKVLHTPGHTPESSCYLLLDENGKEHAIFTGDTLFLGDVGRPDLALKGDLTAEDLAGLLYESLHNKILPLPDDVIVYPGHGAGSSCGKNMSNETVGTLGEQKKTNYALRADIDKTAFIKELTSGILPPPQYFAKNARLNQSGYESVEAVIARGNKALTVQEFEEHVKNGALILDVRTQQDFIAGHIPNSLFIGLNGTFAMWVGALIEELQQPVVLISPEGKEEEAILRLSRVGYDNCLGYLKGGVSAYANSGKTLDTLLSISATELVENLSAKNVLDVRKPGEYDAAHLPNALHFPLDFMLNESPELNKEQTYHVHCAGGYRSVIAISLLRQRGFRNLIDVAGGFAAIRQTNVPLLEQACSKS